MSAENCKECPVKNIFGGRCRGTEEECIADTTVARLIEINPDLDRASAEALINSKTGCVHIDDVKTKRLPFLSVRQNPNIEEPESGDPATLTGTSFQMLLRQFNFKIK